MWMLDQYEKHFQEQLRQGGIPRTRTDVYQ
jgi:hypothetical protein